MGRRSCQGKLLEVVERLGAWSNEFAQGIGKNAVKKLVVDYGNGLTVRNSGNKAKSRSRVINDSTPCATQIAATRAS